MGNYKTVWVLRMFDYVRDLSRRTGHAEKFVYKRLEDEAKAKSKR